MARQKNSIVICCAASYFARESRNLGEIANTFDVSERTVRRWSQDTEWEESLNVWGYKGDRSFEIKPKRDARRDAPTLFEAAQAAYKKALVINEPRHRIARIVAEEIGLDKLTSKRVREWAKTYRWAENLEKADSVKVCCAATYFVFKSRDIAQIAETFEVSEHEILHWIEEHPEWMQSLEICGYTRYRSFERQAQNSDVIRPLKKKPKNVPTVGERERERFDYMKGGAGHTNPKNLQRSIAAAHSEASKNRWKVR